ncbi:MAG: formate dehydrogenase subunit alpha [Acidimicrobiia bacterium]
MIREASVVRIEVDGSSVELAEGVPLLHALQRAGIDVPSLCDDGRLKPYGECRMCLVRVDGQSQPVASCATLVRPGMVIQTAPADIEAARAGVLRMLARHYPPDAVLSDPDEAFHRLLRRYEVDATGNDVAELRDDSHPCIAIDMNRCIDCFRCVRICDEVQGQFAWQIAGRGADTHVVPSGADSLVDSPCVSCGACVDSCPTGALEDRSVVQMGLPSRWTRTTCSYCGVGCELHVGTRDDRIVTCVPARDAPVNRGHLCVKGRYAHGFVHASDRATAPMVRDAAGWRTVTWDDAIHTVVQRFRDVGDRFGPNALGVLASARATNEDNYVLQKFARVVLRTNNVDGCARVCHSPSAAALGAIFGTGAATNSFDDIEAAATILVCGANPTENHPIVGARIKQAARRGAALIVIDPRCIEVTEYATMHLRPRPGTNVLVLNAMSATVIEEGLVDEAFARQRVDGLDEFGRHVARYAPELVADRCGVDATDLRAAARLYATNRPSMALHGLGITEHTQGTDGVTCIANLALLTGNVGRPGCGVNPLRGQNNVQGSAHMGCEPHHLTGYAPLTDAARFEARWGATLPRAEGLDAMQMLDAAREGTVRALWVVGWDILQTQPNMTETDAALADLDALVVQDLFINETARAHATIFLPACSSFEKDGTFMNGERRIQRVRRALEPIGDSKPDWEITCLVARAMGRGDAFAFTGPNDIWEEIRSVWPGGAGVDYKRLEAPGGLQWPCPDDNHPGTRILHTSLFGALGPVATLRSIDYCATPESTDHEYEHVLVTGRTLEQFNAGTMTRRSLTEAMHPTDVLEISPTDAATLGIDDGDMVRLTSRYGTVVLPARVTGRVSPGELFTSFSDPAAEVNRLTGRHRDPITNTPEYKVTAVHLEASD